MFPGHLLWEGVWPSERCGHLSDYRVVPTKTYTVLHCDMTHRDFIETIIASATSCDSAPPDVSSTFPRDPAMKSPYIDASLPDKQLGLIDYSTAPVIGKASTETETEIEAKLVTPVKCTPGRPKESRNKIMASLKPIRAAESRREGRTFTEVEGLALAKVWMKQCRIGPNQDATCMWESISECWEIEINMGPRTPGWLRVKWQTLQRDVKIYLAAIKAAEATPASGTTADDIEELAMKLNCIRDGQKSSDGTDVYSLP